MDIYSNILYVKEAFASLSHLAHRASTTDKYRPESACIIGNYYSLKGHHEKARSSLRPVLSAPETAPEAGSCVPGCVREALCGLCGRR